MAEEKVMNSIEYYEHKEKKLIPGTTDSTRGFYNESILTTNPKTGNPYHVPDDSLQDEKDATTENGWIAPYDYYKEETRSGNSSRDVSNGMIQKSEIADSKDYFYKNLYWWCEDLHNWCIYKTDCVNNNYMNSFFLHVWNGLNSFVPAFYSFYADPKQKFAPLQNKIIEKKINNFETIVMHRGTMKNDPSKWAFGNGPITINHAFVLKKSDKFSINSDNKFQTIRWSTPRHIASMSEYEEGNNLMRVNSGGEDFYVDIKIRHNFAATKSMNIFGNGEDTTGIPKRHPWCQQHKFNACDRHTKYGCTFENFTANDRSAGGNGALIYKKESQCNSYNDFDRYISWDNNIPSNFVNKAITSDIIEKYGPVNMKSPLNYRGRVYNHVLLNAFAMEKIFAVYFYKINSQTNQLEILKNLWINQETDNPDIGHDAQGNTSAPVYMSFVDIQMFFYKIMKEYWHMPVDYEPDSVPFTYDLWKKKNYTMLLAILGMLKPPDIETPNMYYEMEYKNQEDFVSTIIDGVSYFSGQYPVVLYTIKNTDTDLTIGEFPICPLITEGIGWMQGVQWEPTPSVVAVFEAICPLLGGVLRTDWSTGERIGAGALTATLGVALGPVGYLLANDILNVIDKHKQANTIQLPPYVINIFNYKKVNGKYQLADTDPVQTFGSATDLTGATTLANDILPMLNSAFITGNSEFVEDFDSFIYGYKMFGARQPIINDPATSNMREGVSIGNPAVYRLPTGDIALATQLHWGGKKQLIGGPGDNAYTSNQMADKFINEICQGYFGKGLNKTINDHWLKEYKLEKDQNSKEGGLVLNESLEAGYVFEQINNNSNEKMKMTISTYRPLVVTTVSGENVDVAKKW